MNPVAILCRHGNTFNKGERVFWVGKQEDLALTEEGIRQAVSVAEALVAAGVPVSQVLTGPLQRTRAFAAEICARVPLSEPARIDNRLDELDYGAWSGLTDAEIEERFGKDELAAWRDHGVRPSTAQFQPSESVVRGEAESLLEDFRRSGGVSLAVTSNGRLRELGLMLQDLSGNPLQAPVVSTGCACVLVFREPSWRIVAWNIKPAEIASVLDRAV